MCKVSALNMKIILNRLRNCVFVKQIDWNNFFWLFEKNWFFTFLTQHFISKKKKILKVRKNEFWWHIWACHSHFSRYRVFNCQNWIKILVFTNFFSLVTYTTLLQIKMAKVRKKVWFSEVATPTVSPFCMWPYKGHYIYTSIRSFFGPIGLKTTLSDLSTFFS